MHVEGRPRNGGRDACRQPAAAASKLAIYFVAERVFDIWRFHASILSPLQPELIRAGQLRSRTACREWRDNSNSVCEIELRPECRPSPIVTDRPRTSQISGPAHHRINAENAYFYRLFANSNIAVTPKVTPFHSARDSGRKIVSIWPAERPKPSSLDSF